MSFNPLPFDLLLGLKTWAVVVFFTLLVGAVAVTSGALFTTGLEGFVRLVRLGGEGLRDLLFSSPRRIWALAVLTMREATRRKSLLVLAIFGVLFLFAGWFLNDPDVDPELQVKRYVVFVFSVMDTLVLAAMALMACWSLPEDIRARSLHTVVTKPVRRQEIILGRVLGFVLTGTGILLVMAVVGYVWMYRQLPRRARDMLVARVPVYGDLTFLSRDGTPAKEGINVGDEWMFRSYIEGNTQARAIYRFANFDVDRFGKQQDMRLETNFEVFRSYKGTIGKGVLCQLTAVNDSRKLRAPLRIVKARDSAGRPTEHQSVFEVREYRQDVHDIDRELVDESGTGRTVDLLKDMVDNGTLQIEVRCLSSQQYLGMARPDLFVRLPDRPFWQTYAKGVIGIELMMVLVVVLGVTFSAFVKGPIAMIGTAFVLSMGAFGMGWLRDWSADKLQGSGTIESLYRIPAHLNPMVPITDGSWFPVVAWIDERIKELMWAVSYLLPDLKPFFMTEYVANGFDVPWAPALLPSIAATLGYCIPWILIAFFSLKFRELEAK